MVNAVKILIEAEDKASKTIDTVNDNLVDLWKDTKTVGQTMSDFGERNKETFWKMAVAGGIAFGAIVAGAKSSISAFAESQAQLVRVDQIIKNTDLKSVGLWFDQAAKAAREFGDKLQNSVGISGELAAESYAKLLQVTKSQTEAQKLATLAADLSVAKQMDMWSATKVVTMALAGNQKILKEYGIEVSDTASKQEIMGALMEKVGWQAEAFGKTIEWQQQILSETFGDMQEAIGGALAPAFQQLLAVVQPVIASFVSRATENPELLGNIILIAWSIAWLVTVVGTLWLAIPAIVAWFGTLATVMWFILSPIWLIVAAIVWLAYIIITNRDVIKATFMSWVSYIQAAIEPFVTWITSARSSMTTAITAAWDAAWVWINENFWLYIEYLSAIFAAFKALFTGDFQWFVDNIRLAWELWLTMMRTFFANIGIAIVGVANTLWTNIKSIFNAGVTWIKDAFVSAKDAVAAAFSSMFSGLEGIAKSIFNGIVATIEWFINKAINGINSMINAANSVGGKIGLKIETINPVSIGRLAHGGIAGQWYFGGGVVKWAAWNDKVPAMLTAGEVVLNAAQQRSLAWQLGWSSPVININISGNDFFWSDDDFADKIGDTIMQKFKMMASFESF